MVVLAFVTTMAMVVAGITTMAVVVAGITTMAEATVRPTVPTTGIAHTAVRGPVIASGAGLFEYPGVLGDPLVEVKLLGRVTLLILDVKGAEAG
jgi:hypothetical protein